VEREVKFLKRRAASQKTAAQVWLDHCSSTASVQEAVQRVVGGVAESDIDLADHGPAVIAPLFVASALAGVRPRAVSGDALATFGPPALDRLRHLEMLARRGDRHLRDGVRAAVQTAPPHRGRPVEEANAAADQVLQDLRQMALEALSALHECAL